VVSCVPPYTWDNCTTTSLVDNATAEHNAPCLQGCGPILRKYDALGGNGSQLGASTGPERSVGDGRGRFVPYQHGAIYWTKGTGAHAVHGAALAAWREVGGARGRLGYPTRERAESRTGSGWVQRFQHGVVCDSVRTPTASVWGSAYRQWMDRGGHHGELGYPTADRVTATDGTWVQTFEHGALTG
jgi:uncharacterized protein with LGFP repeats